MWNTGVASGLNATSSLKSFRQPSSCLKRSGNSLHSSRQASLSSRSGRSSFLMTWMSVLGLSLLDSLSSDSTSTSKSQMAVHPNIFRCVSEDTLKSTSFVRLNLPLKTLARKVPNTGTDDPVAVIYCVRVVCRVGLPNLVQVRVKQKLSLAPLSTSKPNVLRSISNVSRAGLFPGTELILWTGFSDVITLTSSFLSLFSSST